MALYGAKIAPDTIKGNAANGLNRIGMHYFFISIVEFKAQCVLLNL